MTESPDSRRIKACCGSFYESDMVRALLGDVFHPGGLNLTSRVGRQIGLKPEDHLLDVACGRGASSVFLAETFGCSVTGLDYSQANVAASEEHALERGVTEKITFRRGDAEGLPFEDSEFDAVLSECSFCTFPSKERAGIEMARVLRPGGRLGLTDMTVTGELPEDMTSLLSWVSCVGGAASAEMYVGILEKAGFGGFSVEDHRDALVEMTDGIRRRIMGVEFAAGLGKIDLGEVDLDEAKRVLKRALELIESGNIGYTLIAAGRAARRQEIR